MTNREIFYQMPFHQLSNFEIETNFQSAKCSSGVVARSMGAYKRLSGHLAGPVLGWVARVEYPVPKHYTCQAVRSGFQESFSWLSIVVRMRRKIQVPPT